MKRVLVLGSGFVAAPLLDDFLGHAADETGRPEPVALDLASLEVDRAAELLAGRPHTRALDLDVHDEARLAELVGDADVVVSLLPADLHPKAARACLERRVPLVTTSYVSPEIRALDSQAQDQGVLILCECGLDPGIDHMLAMETLRRVEREGGEVLSFLSACGGLPAPENKNNPWCYKVSWSPRGVLLAARGPVRWIEDGDVVEAESPFVEPGPREFSIEGVGRLEAYPNRDSLPYRDYYGLGHARDVFRGSLRYPGWCETFRVLDRIGLLSIEPETVQGTTWADLLRSRTPGVGGDLRTRLARSLEVPESHSVLGRLAWLGLLDDEPLPEELGEACSPLDALAWRMAERLRYQEGEKDLVALEHRFVVEDGHDSHRRRIRSRLVVTGPAGDRSAMAKTVGITAAVAARRVLDAEVTLTGVHIPVSEELAEPILEGLRDRGLQTEETVET